MFQYSSDDTDTLVMDGSSEETEFPSVEQRQFR
jgi:hypothetical protein